MTTSAPMAGLEVFLGEGMVTFSRRGLHGRIVDILGLRVIGGELPPGTVIDPGNLVVELEVSRTVVREAIKVLSAKGLLDARPRTGTFVLPRDRWNLLDADVIRWRNNGTPDARLMVELEEVRQIIEPWGAWLAAERRLPAHIVVLEEALASMISAKDIESRILADVRFHHAILAAAHNELLERLDGVLGPALQVRDELAFQHTHPDDYTRAVHAHRDVLDCIKDGRANDAFSAMSDLLQSAAADTEVSLRRGPSKPLGRSRSTAPETRRTKPTLDRGDGGS